MQRYTVFDMYMSWRRLFQWNSQES